MNDIDIPKIQRTARNSLPIIIKTPNITHETEEYLEQILSVFLTEYGQKKILPQISYCLRELVVNANKANIKRIFFMEKKLDINNDEDYRKGMETFKKETLENMNHYFEKQKELNLYIKIIFQAVNNVLVITVHNNTRISKKEQMRVYDRIARSRLFNSLEDAMTAVLDSSEGAGLGILLIVLMLKKLGINEDAFDIDIDGDETVVRLTIPFASIQRENLALVSQEIVKEVNQLPQFPENIVAIQKLIDDPNSEIQDITKKIAMDMSLTADILKLVNSAQYMVSKKVDTIVNAVKLLGIHGLKNLLYSYGTQKILKSDIKDLWEHASHTAFFSYILAKNFIKNKNILDDAYIGGTLHDIGKVIFYNVHPKLIDKIRDLAKERNVSNNIFEDLSAGLNHAEIGAMIAEKWNFPDNLIAAIKYHHEPESAPEELKDTISTIYLGNYMANYLKNEISFEQISTKILKKFDITNEEQFKALLQKFNEAFDKEAAS